MEKRGIKVRGGESGEGGSGGGERRDLGGGGEIGRRRDWGGGRDGGGGVKREMTWQTKHSTPTHTNTMADHTLKKQ